MFTIVIRVCFFVHKLRGDITHGTEATAISVNGAALDMKGGTINVSGQDSAGIWVQSGGNAVMSGGSIKADGMAAIGAAAYGGSTKSVFTLDGGSITSSGYGSMGIYVAGANQKTVVNGGEINVSGNSSYGIQAVEMGATGHEIEVTGGTIYASGARSYAVYLEMDNSLKVSGGILKSANAPAIVYFQGGNTGTITGGAIKGKTYGIQIANAANNSLNISGDPVISGESGSISTGGNRYKTTPAVTISGGYFNGAVIGGVPSDKTDNYAKYDITGGLFTDEFEDSAIYNYSLAKDYTPDTYSDEVKAEESNKLKSVSVENDGVTYNYQVAPIEKGYALMNIPYGDFYAAELEAGTPRIDAVTSATKNKPRTGTLAGGSYHKNEDGSDISGAIYPVYVNDFDLLDGKTAITDESSVSITVTNRGQAATTVYEGKDALFQSDDYSYYKLSETPAHYKVLKVGTDGSFEFGPAQGDVTEISGGAGTVSAAARHADIEIKLSLPDGGIKQGDKYAGVIVTDSEGNKYGFRHVLNVWRSTEIGWNQGECALGGKNIKNIKYFTTEGTYSYDVDIAIPTEDELSARKDVKSAQASVDALKDNASSEEVIKAYEELSKAYHALADALKNAGVENAELTSLIAAVDKSVEKLKAATDAEKTALQDEKTTADAEKAALQDQVDALQKKTKDLENKVNELESSAKKTSKITKAKNTLKATGKTVKVKRGKKRVIKATKAFKVSNAKGGVSYKKISGNKKITVAKNGKITVKKGLKKGTYKVKVSITAAGNSAYAPLTVTRTVKIKVK